METTIKVTANTVEPSKEQASRSEWDVASDLEDVLTGLERAQKSAYIFLKDMTDEFLSPKGHPDFYGKSRLDDYTTGLYLVEDRIFDERARLRALIDELYELVRDRRKEAAAPPRKTFNNNKHTGEGASV